MLEDGGSLLGVAYLAGHKQVTTTNTYLHANRKAAEEVLAVGATRSSDHQTRSSAQTDARAAADSAAAADPVVAADPGNTEGSRGPLDNGPGPGSFPALFRGRGGIGIRARLRI